MRLIPLQILRLCLCLSPFEFIGRKQSVRVMRNRQRQNSLEAASGFVLFLQLRPRHSFAIQQLPIFALLAKQRFSNADDRFVGSLIQQGINTFQKPRRIFLTSCQLDHNLHGFVAITVSL